MTEAHQSLEEILFDLAVQKPTAGERAAFLDHACRDNPALRATLEELIEAHFGATGLLREPARRDPDPARVDAPAQMIGRYKLLEKIGEGGFGEVWMSEQREPVKRRVALKLIKLGMDSRQIVARFEAERQALAVMDHPNIAKIFDAGVTEAGRPYFVMELVRGTRITDYCDQNQLPTRERLELFIKVCQAIQHAHQKGIIHRDIKPSNILVTLHDGVPVPRVIDFGIAKATQQELTDKTIFTQFQQFMGTPAYISPEQAEMSGLDIDTRADIYSLGVLLYELLVGQTPFDANEMMRGGIDGLRRTIREQEPIKPSTRFKRLSAAEVTTTAQRHRTNPAHHTHQLRGDLDWIVMKCLEKDRARRYETANGLAADIQRYLARDPIAARPPSAAYRLQKTWQRNKVALTSAAVVIGALMAGTGVSTWQAARATRAQAQAEAERERANAQAQRASASEQQSRRLLYVADMNLGQQALNLNNLGKARRLLDRHRPAPGEEDLRGWEWRYLWQLARGAPHVTLTNRPAIGSSASLSPDGTFLAVGWRGGQAELWSVPGRRLIRTLSGPNSSEDGRVAFSPVRNLLAALTESNAVRLHDLDSGQELNLWQAPADFPCAVRDLDFSPDGSRLVIYGKSGPELGDRIWVIEVASRRIEGDHRTGFSLTSHFGTARLCPDNRRLVLGNTDLSKNRVTLVCVEAGTGRKLWETEPQQGRGLAALAVSHDGETVASATGYEDSTIQIWEAATGRPVRRLQGHTAWVCKLAFARDGSGERLISSSADQTIRAWDTGSWNERKAWRGHADEVQAMAVAAATPLIASVGKDGDVKVWTEEREQDVKSQRHLPVDYDGPRPMPLDQSRFLLLPRGGRAQVVDLMNDLPPEMVPGLEVSEDVLAHGNGTICHWKPPNQILVSQWRGNEFKLLGAVTLDSGERPLAAAFHPARQRVAWAEAGSPDTVSLAQLSALGPRMELTADVAGMAPIEFSDQGEYLMAQSGTSVRVWSVETGRILASVNGVIRNRCFAGGGHVLVVVLQTLHDHEVQFHDLRHAGQVRRVAGRHYSNRLAVSPDGGLVAMTTTGTQVHLFDSLRGEAIEVALQGNPQGNYGVTFSADGRRLISTAARLETLKVWDVGSRQELLSLASPSAGLAYADWSADGNVILGGPEWQVWRAPSWVEISAAERRD